MTCVWVFPGQGSQRKGMGEDLFDRYPQWVAEADAMLGYSLRTLCLEDPDGRLNKTEFTQPALFAVSALSFLARRDDGAALPDVYAGHSLGEFNALFAAGAFDFATGIDLVAKRGELMSKAPRGAMAAVVGLGLGKVRELLGSTGLAAVDIANINSANQIVISGLHEDIERCEPVFKSAGARFARLSVSAAFHSRYMREAEAQFAAFIHGRTLHPLRADVISNRTARPHTRDAYLPQLIEQVSHPVNWYESMSCLLSQGDVTMEEIGPGNVLSGLFAKIRKDPMPMTATENVAATGPRPTGKPRIVFMYSGQGSQYYGMGRELYATDLSFRDAMDGCNRIYREMIGRDMLAEIYGDANKWREMSDIMLSHPALYSIGYSLTATMRNAGIRPDAVLGYSLGEYVAATVSNAIAHEDAMRLVIHQAELMKSNSAAGGMLSVLAPMAHFHECPDLYRDTVIGSVNFDKNFVISGSTDALDEVVRRLRDASIVSSRLPVEYPFHSPLMDPLEDAFRSTFESVSMSAPMMPQYSPATVGRLSMPDVDHYWRVTREPVDFRSAVEVVVRDGDCRFVDLSPTGTLSGFIKYGFGSRLERMAVMNQFGRNTETVAGVMDQLKA
jgi:malonyl CoA-acyl carrier protein transacylase